MTVFEYQGRDQKQQLVSGTLDANSVEAVAAQLQKDNITPTTIREVKKEAQLTDIFKKSSLFKQKVKVDDLITFCRQMYTLTKAGVPIVKILSRLAETMRSKALVDVLKDAIAVISSGQSFTTALKKHPDIFKPVFISIVEAGENSGQLEEAFNQLSIYLELEAKTVKQVKAATRYPMIVIVVLTLAFLVVNFMVIPAFTQLFSQFGAELPLPTRILIGTSDFMIANWLYILIGAMGIFFGLRYILRTPKGRFTWDRLKLKTPVFGSLLNRIVLARFARTFSMIMRTGVPLVQGIELVAHAVGNEFICARIMLMRDAIERGETLTKTAIESKLFSPLVIQMLSVGEESGSIDTLLQQVAEFYEREIDYDLERLGDLIEPFLLVIMASVVLVLALGVFLPMWDMVSFAKVSK